MLHLISQVSVDRAILERVGNGDVVVLLDAAVLRALHQGERADAFVKLLARARCCVLTEHLLNYGISEAELVNGIEIIDYPGLVNLTVAEPVIQTWN